MKKLYSLYLTMVTVLHLTVTRKNLLRLIKEVREYSYIDAIKTYERG
jgi:hypothetical protein